MSISRRQFILGTAAGLILPSYYDKVLSYFENHGEPLLQAPKHATTDLFALDLEGNSFRFNLGDPWAEPPEMTVREFAIHYYESEEEFVQNWDYEEVDFDQLMDPNVVYDLWERTASPHARAFHLLKSLDLGPDLSGGEAVGEIKFIDGPCPGNDYLGVEAPSEVDISLLQKRLNELDTGIRISMDKY